MERGGDGFNPWDFQVKPPHPFGAQKDMKIRHVTLNLVLNSFQYCFRVLNEEIPKQVRDDREAIFSDERS